MTATTEPTATWAIRNMPQSTQRWHAAQAKLRGLTLAQWLTLLKQQEEARA